MRLSKCPIWNGIIAITNLHSRACKPNPSKLFSSKTDQPEEPNAIKNWVPPIYIWIAKISLMLQSTSSKSTWRKAVNTGPNGGAKTCVPDRLHTTVAFLKSYFKKSPKRYAIAPPAPPNGSSSYVILRRISVQIFSPNHYKITNEMTHSLGIVTTITAIARLAKFG